MWTWLFGSWRTVGYVALSTVLIYLSVVVALRLGERRTLTSMTAYDFAVAIALGSIIGRTATTRSPSYVQGVAGVVALLACHHTLSLLRARSSLFRRLVDRPPIVLARDGEVSATGLRRAHMIEDDLRMVLRERGIDDLSQARLVLLEARGEFSVIRGQTPTYKE